MTKPYVSGFSSGCSSLVINPKGSRLAIRCPLILKALTNIIALIEFFADSSDGGKFSAVLFSSESSFDSFSESKLSFLIFFLGAQLGPSIVLEIISLSSLSPSKNSFQPWGSLLGFFKYSE